jgi:hypothetical protein
MALNALSLTAASSLVNGTSYTTASVSLKVNKLYVVCIVTQGVNTTDRQVATLSGAGQTWQLLDSSLFSSFSAAVVYVARPAAINSGALTITTTLSQDTCSWAVFEIDDLAAGLAGSTAADAIGAISKVTAANTTTITATPSFTALRNGTFAINFWDRDVGGGTAVATAGSGFATSAQANAIDGGNAYGTAVHGQFRVENDTSADVTWSAAGVGLASFAFEVKAAVDPAAVRSLRSAYPWNGVPWGSWGWLGSPATGGPIIEARQFSSSGVGSFNPVSVQIQGRQFSSAGVGSFSPVSVQIQGRQLSSAGAGLFSPVAGTIEARSFTSNGTAAATFDGVDATGGATIEARSFASAGSSTANFTAQTIQARQFASSGAGSASFAAAKVEARSFTSAGVGAAVWQNATTVIEARSFAANGTSSAAWTNGTDQIASGNDGGDGGGAAKSASRNGIMRKLLIAYEDEPARKSASKALKKISDAERSALKKLAKRIEAQGVDSYEEIAQKVTESLNSIGYEPKETHIDWLMYYARILAYQIAQESFSEEEEVLMVMMA